MKNSKVALVTGGMDSLGTAICRRLRVAGFKVATTYAPEYTTPQAWQGAQRDDGFNFLAFKVDAGDPADCAWMVQKLLAATGRLDVLVNHGGAMGEGALRQMLPDQRPRNNSPHASLGGVVHVSKQAIAPMTQQRWGRIINLCAPGAPDCAPPCSPPCAPSEEACAGPAAGVHGFTRALALEVARLGITVNTVSPGYLYGSTAARLTGQDLRARIVPQIPVGRLGRADEVAALVAYLASEEAAFVTGANIAINGGQYLS